MTHSLPLTWRIACLLVTCLAAMIAAATPSLAMSRIQHIVSPGGIEAWFVQESTVPLISVQYAFVGGAAQDPPDKPGVGSLVSDLLDEGSGKLDSEAFHEAIERRAIQMSFGVTRDYFRGSLLMLKDDEGAAFDLLRTALTSPHFAPADVERIRSQVMSGLVRETTNPNALATRKFLNLAYGNNAYGRPSSGTLKTVPTITVADMRDYVRRVLAKNTLKVAVVGDIDPVSLGKLLDKAFGGLPTNADLRPLPDIEAATPPKQVFVPLDVPQTVIAFGSPGIMRHDPNFMAAYLDDQILAGNGMTSRLAHDIREKRGLVYSIRGSLVWMQHSALFVGNTGTRANRTGETIDAIDKDVRRMAKYGPTQQELDEAKSYVKGSEMLALDTSAKLASALLQYQLDGLPIDYLEKRSAIIDAVTLDDAKRAASLLWGHGLLTVVVGRAPQAAARSVATPGSTAAN